MLIAASPIASIVPACAGMSAPYRQRLHRRAPNKGENIALFQRLKRAGAATIAMRKKPYSARIT